MDGHQRLQRELRLQLALSSALIAIKGYAALEVERAFTRAREICERLGDPPELFSTLYGLHAVYSLRDKLGMAHAAADELMRRAQSADDPALLILAHTALETTSNSMGKPLIANQHFESMIALYDPERQLSTYSGDNRILPLSYAGLNLWALGYPDEALKRSNEALALARTLSMPHDEAFAEFLLVRLLQLRRDARAVQEAAEHLIALSAEHGFTFWLVQAQIELGGAMAEQGRYAEGIARMQEGLAELAAALPRPQYFCLLAEACIETDRFDDGLSSLAELLAAVNEDENRFYESEMHRLNGKLLLKTERFKYRGSWEML